MREKFLCFTHSSYLCSRRQKMQSIMKKKIYIIIAFLHIPHYRSKCTATGKLRTIAQSGQSA